MIVKSPVSTLANPAAKVVLRDRVTRLTPTSQRRWGRMNVHQMVCHLSDGFRMATGERPPKSIDNIFTRTFVRYVALHSPLKWPQGVRTLPEVDQEIGGTKPSDWIIDHTELLRQMDTFTPKEGSPHPIFGPLSTSEWNVWGFRHVDHHLRQFGA
jgi:hypothetical protein